jgi:hypothetical protein
MAAFGKKVDTVFSYNNLHFAMIAADILLVMQFL